MGFTTGFLGGATLTYSLLYLTLYVHKANRKNQHAIITQSSSLLNSIVEPVPPVPDPPVYEVRPAGLAEVLKDKWNAQIEKLVNDVQTTDWTKVREEAEDKMAAAWSSLRQTDQAQKLEEAVKENVAALTDRGKDKVEAAKEATREPRLLELK